MKKITINLLNAEYQDWTSQYGQGRDKSSIRFGQYLWINYDLDSLFNYGPDDQRDGGKDGFATERAIDAFNIINSQLIKQL
jgi:hypothetical protein